MQMSASRNTNTQGDEEQKQKKQQSALVHNFSSFTQDLTEEELTETQKEHEKCEFRSFYQLYR